MRYVLVGAALGLSLAAAPARAAPANTLRDMFANLNRCLASVKMTEGTDVTIAFMLNRRGGVIGKPRLTHVHLAGDDASKKESTEAIAKGFDQCLPTDITDALGGAIAGRLIFYRLTAARDEL